MKNFVLGILIVAMPFFLYAGEVKGLIDEFMEVEDFLSKKKPSPEFRKKMLEKNLVDSLKNTLSKKFSNPKEELKDIKIEDIDYERQENTYKYYIRFKEFYIFYEFAMDPEIFIQLPQAEIVYVRPPNYQTDKPHKEADTIMPDPNVGR